MNEREIKNNGEKKIEKSETSPFEHVFVEKVVENIKGQKAQALERTEGDKKSVENYANVSKSEITEANEITEVTKKAINEATQEAQNEITMLNKRNETSPENSQQYKERISNEEYAREKTSKIDKLIKNNEFEKAAPLVFSVTSKALMTLNTERYQFVKENIEKICDERVKNLILEKNDKMLRDFFSNQNLNHVLEGNELKNIPKDKLADPKIAEGIKNTAIYSFDASSFYADGTYEKVWNNIERTGIISKAEIAKLEPIVTKAKGSALWAFKSSHYDPEKFMRIWDNLEKAGIISKAEIIKLKPIVEEAKYAAVLNFKYNQENFLKTWNNLEKTGIISKAEIIAMPEIQKIAKEKNIDLKSF